jgi:hypothetical protein
MGFGPRTNIRETYGELEPGPHPQKWGIMQLQFGGSIEYITYLATDHAETRESTFKPLGIRFLSGEEVSYSVINQLVNLPV